MQGPVDAFTLGPADSLKCAYFQTKASELSESIAESIFRQYNNIGVDLKFLDLFV